MFDFGLDSLVTSDNFEAFCGVSSTDLSAQEKLRVELSVKGINAQIRKFCNTHFSLVNYVEVWDSQGSDVLIPSEIPIASITSIKVSSDGSFDNVEPIAAIDYVIHPSKQFISMRNYRFPKGRGMVEVKYSAGYSAIPEDVQLAVFLSYNFLMALGSNPGLKSIGKMNEQQTIDDKVLEYGMPAQVYSLLKPYCKIEAPLSVMFARVT
jgi:hypothetical protein